MRGMAAIVSIAVFLFSAMWVAAFVHGARRQWPGNELLQRHPVALTFVVSALATAYALAHF